MRKLACTVAVLFLLGGVVPAQQSMEDVEIGTVKVADGIWMLTGQGGNIGVCAGDDGVFLIDDQFAPLTEKIRSAVAAISSRPIRFVLNTHWHGDHTGGNENLGEAGVLIVAHDNVRRRMSTEQFMEAFNRNVPPSPGAALPVVTFNDAVTFHMNDEEIHAFHVAPAHTDGDSIIHFRQANAMHMGDLFFNGFYPFIDHSSGGTIDGMVEAAARGLALADDETRIIPGHGPLGDRKALAAYHDMLRTVRDRIKPMVLSGKSADEVVAARPSADFDAKWGGGFMEPENWVRIIYLGLKKNQ